MCPAASACSTCLRNCSVMHKRKHGEPALGSAFFKIMFGNNFDNFLQVPPAFVKRVKSEIGRKVFLQDSSGQQWDVSLINKRGSFFFKTGWRNFVEDHGIQMGDLVVFYYCKDSDFLVEVFGRSGCLQRYYNLDDVVADEEAARSSVPLKRSRDLPFEQSSRKKRFLSSDVSDSELDVVRRPRNVADVEEPVRVARKAPTESQAREWSRKNVEEPVIMARKPRTEWQAHERSSMVEPSFTFHRDENRPKVVPETVVEPCFTASRDQNRRKALPEVEILADPCFIPTRDKNVVSEHGRECLFDLSAFEMPSHKSTTIDVGEEMESRLDLSTCELPQNETCGVKDMESNQVLSVIAEDVPTMDRDDNSGGCLLDMSVFNLPEYECAIVGDKGDLQEKQHGQESDKCQNTAIEDASDMNLNISEKANEEFSFEPREAELRRREDAPITSSSPTVDLPTDPIALLKIVDEPETSKLSAVSAEEMSLNKWEMKVNVEGECSLGAGISISEQNDGDIGGTQIHMMDSKGESRRRTNQELRESQDIHDAMADFSFGCISNFNEQANSSREKSLFSGEINSVVKIEADVHPFVKHEPVDYDAPSENVVKMTCPVPRGAENFLVLPGPLPLTVRVDRRRTRPKQLLVLLRDSFGRIWPLVYHNKSGFKVLTSGWKEFMKANDIQPGDECIFTVENSEEALLNVEVVPRN